MLEDLRSLLGVETDDLIIHSVEAMKPKRDTVESLREVVQFGDDCELVELLKQLVEVRYLHSTLLDELRIIVSFDDERSVVGLLAAKSELNSLKERLLAIMQESQAEACDESIDIDGLQKRLVAIVRKSRDVLRDYDILMENAKFLGFTGKSALDAANFLSDLNFEKKKCDVLAESHRQIEEVRNVCATQIRAMEKRLAESNKAVAEHRQAKLAALKAAAERQDAMQADLDHLQNELDQSESRLAKCGSVKNELVRLAAGQTCDAELLKQNLNFEQRLLLKLK